jgi:hypothetical protein
MMLLWQGSPCLKDELATGCGGWLVPRRRLGEVATRDLSDGTTRGGHLLRGQVWPTLEVIIRDTPVELRKIDRPELGLALIDLGS